MRLALIALIVIAPVVFGQTAERQIAFTTAPHEIALQHLAASSDLEPDVLSNVYLARQYTSLHNGVTHLVYRQRFQGIDVQNAAWAINIGPDGAILSSGGKLYPEPDVINFADQMTASTAVQSAVREVNPQLASTLKSDEVAMSALQSRSTANANPYQVRFAAGDLGGEIDGKLVWFAHRDTLLLAWMFNVADENKVTNYDVAIEAATGAVIHKKATTLFQSLPKGLVFDQGSPQPNPRPGERLTSAPPLVERSLVTLAGDRDASPLGWIANNETAGYNAIVGENLLGQMYLTNVRTTQGVVGNFNFPVSLGPAAPNPLAFTDAANVNLFYWVNRAHDLFYAYGFNEAAGNFQSNNFGRGGLGGDPMLAYTHFGAAAPGFPDLDNATFDTRSINDGTAAMIAIYATTTGPGGFFGDGAYAADVIVHEYTHGVSLRLLPDGYNTFQTQAMGEAWSDFFGLEFTIPEGSPADGSYPVGEYWGQSWGRGIRTRPYSTDTVINPLTYAELGRVLLFGPQVHSDGEIWAEALWEARANLIAQFGETEGRRRIRQLVIDGLMLSPPSPTMVDARDAILLADRLDFEGSSQEQLWKAFAKRGLGALAFSDGGDTTHVVASFDRPGAAGKLKFYENTFVAGEPIRVLLSDSNLSPSTAWIQISTSSGDLEDLILSRSGSIYAGIILASTASVTRQNGVVNVLPGDLITASYTDPDSGPGATSLVQTTVTTQQPYALSFSPATTSIPAFPNEVRVTNTRGAFLVNLPFDFPFFSKKYRSMLVYHNGIIGFEPSLFTTSFGFGCNDATELRRTAAIAPLFANLTFGTAQPNEGIFYSVPSPDTVAIRWAAETLPTPPLITPAIAEPVNFAVTISAGGVVTFYYGSGNANLHTAFQPLSTCGSQPAIGLSNGHDVYARTIALRTLTNSPSIIFYPGFNASTAPRVILERPAADETVRGVLRVTGIAYEPASSDFTFITRRDVLIDGVSRSLGTTVARADYCATNPVAGCPLVGFQSDINLTTLNLTAGRHTVAVRVTNSRGAYTETSPVSINIESGSSRSPIGAIEAPASGSQLSGTVTFRGYAYAPDLRVTRADLLIDGLNYPGVLYGLSRPDICGTLSPTPINCPNVGWTVSLNTRAGFIPLPDGPHAMQLRVLDETGRYTLIPEFPIPFTVKNGPQPVPAGAVTSIRPFQVVSGVISVSGYAYSPVGRVTSVVLVVDGTDFALAQYGQPRHEECAALSGVTACPNIGFSVGLDTRSLWNGPHVIGVRITNDAGMSVIVPDLTANGMNVTVSNP